MSDSPMSRKASPPSFAIKNADDFFQKIVLPSHDDFLKENSSSRHALMTIIAVYILYKWVNNKEFCKKEFLTKYPSHSALAEDFDVARHITNGTKHFSSKNVETTTQTGFSSAFSDAFARPLNIVYPDGTAVSVDTLLEKLVCFWKEQQKVGAF